MKFLNRLHFQAVQLKVFQTAKLILKKKQEIRKYQRDRGVYLWQIAKHDLFEVSEATMSRLMREELSPEDRKRFIAAVDDIAAEERK